MPELTRKLRAAAESDDVDAINALIEAGADPNAMNHAGSTALHAAAYRGSVGASRALLAAGAPLQRKERLRSHRARYRHARGSRQRRRRAARCLRLTMTSIVAATGVASPRLCPGERAALPGHGTAKGSQAAGVTLRACRPFGPRSTSKRTLCPSARVRNPEALIAEKCTNTASEPSVGAMKP